MTADLVPFTELLLDRCVALYVGVFNSAPWHDAWTEEAARETLAEILRTPGFLGLVALEDGQPMALAAGYCEQWHDGRHYYLKEMCVRADRQRRGIGAALLARLEEEARAAGAARLYLLTDREGPAAAFYARHGFYTTPRMALMAHRLVP